MNREEKIAKIENERVIMLKQVQESVKADGEVMSTTAKEVLDVIEFDEKSVKKYEALVNAQELIAKFTEEIASANTVEEVAELRKKLNYYINKIKSEIKKRNIEVSKINDYQEKAVQLRKDISKFIRFLKRSTNVSEIKKLNGVFDTLSDEDKAMLNKLLKNEIRYNSRNLNSNAETIKEENRSEQVAESGKKDEKGKNSLLDSLRPKKNQSFSEEIKKTLTGIPSPKREVKGFMGAFEFVPVKNVEKFDSPADYLKSRVSFFDSQYGVSETYDYDSSFFGNLSNFFKNVPRYMENKKIVKRMERDSSIFYRGYDLLSYMEYLRSKNSIRQGLKSVFSHSYLQSKEGQYLNNHEKCVDWLLDFCNEHNMDISYPMVKTL